MSDFPAELAERVRAAQRAGATAELGRLYHINGFNHAAATCWKILQANEPLEARWPYYHADTLDALGDQEAMTSLVVRALKLDPAYAPAWLKLGNIRFKQGRFDEAAAAYQQRLLLLPGDPYARVGLARISAQSGDTATARHRLESLVVDAPTFAPARNLYAEALAAAGESSAAARERLRGSQSPRFRDADDPWLDGLITDCYDYDKLCVHGMMDTLTHHGDRGLALFHRARRLRPHQLTAYELIGNVHLDQGHSDKAIEIYEAGLRQAPPDAAISATYFVSLSRAYLHAARTAQAVQTARRGLTRLGDTAALHRALGNALRANHEPVAAVAALQAAVDHDPVNAAITYDLARAHIDLGQLEDAVAALHSSHQANPQYPATLALLGRVEADSGRWENALRYLRPLFDGQPDLPAAREQLSFVYLQAGLTSEQAGNLDTAESHYRHGIAVAPNQPAPLAQLGILLLRQNRGAEAVPPLENFHRLASDDARSHLLLGQAYAATDNKVQALKVLATGAEQAEISGDTRTARRCREIAARLK
ncbi:tetratricopeptide repeat protein [Synoicihabitans lomoniglobus]|uniref:Tetratricopeptide repeat protein n=2 Tax=Synoicihabitans lomoniglobus TaxID=2909285 RepID=A0AAF0CSZ5_9BACT|nr:tetratricopeptide repeat protein [Opitutaceae bacterium LMO-M01]